MFEEYNKEEKREEIRQSRQLLIELVEHINTYLNLEDSFDVSVVDEFIEFTTEKIK